jgi:hypothetical protein
MIKSDKDKVRLPLLERITAESFILNYVICMRKGN